MKNNGGERYKQITREILSLTNTKEMILRLDIFIREIKIELKSEESTFKSLLNDGELPFPKDAVEYIDSLRELIYQLEIDRDKIIAGFPIKGFQNSLITSPEPEDLLEPQDTSVPQKEDLNFKKYLDIDELSRYTGIAKSTIYKMTHRRKIPFTKPGGILIFNREKIDEWLANYEKKALF